MIFLFRYLTPFVRDLSCDNSDLFMVSDLCLLDNLVILTKKVNDSSMNV